MRVEKARISLSPNDPAYRHSAVESHLPVYGSIHTFINTHRHTVSTQNNVRMSAMLMCASVCMSLTILSCILR